MYMIDSIHSLIIAQVLGMYLIIMAIVMISRADHYRIFLNTLKSDNGLISVAASCALVIGLLMIVVHNLWYWRPEVLVTIISWLIALGSVLWLSIPEKMLAISKIACRGNWYYVMAGLAIFVGILLLTHGYYIFKVI